MKTTRKKYQYLINNQEVSRDEFKKQLAEVYAKTETVAGWIGIDFPNYEKAENTIKNIQRKNCRLIIVSNNKSFKIKIVNQ